MKFLHFVRVGSTLKRYTIFLLLLMAGMEAKADHITGGEMFYTASQGTNGNILYQVTLKLFMRCNSGRQFNNPAIISIFRRGSNTRVSNIDATLSSQQTIRLSDAGPCVTNPPTVCYTIGTYIFNLNLPPSADGYTLSSQVNFRIAGISNLTQGYTNIGATYTAEIPGFAPVPSGPVNSSAKFTGNDLVVVCANNRFAYSFGATDPDGDELRYSFCNAYVSGGAGIGNNSTPPPDPPYSSVPYGGNYKGSAPLGASVSIDSKTGLITGIAPPTGIYVVTVCVNEIRNGVVIATQRKDLQINIAACDIAAAVLEPEYQLCRTSTTISLINLSNSNLIKTQHWELSNSNNVKVFDTTGTNVNYTFKDTGLFTIKLVINRGQSCSDSTMSIARVYPGFIPSFTYEGICFTRPTKFINNTATVYGAVATMQWDFGEVGATDDTSMIDSPTYTYKTTGTKVAVLKATNTNGCIDTANNAIPIFTKRPLSLSFVDTLICITDSVQLKANGSGIYKWSPAAGIINQNTSSPTVAPTKNTVYYVDLDDQGCLNRDSVLIRVTDHVDLSVMNDTLICRGDAIRLRINSNGFKYAWQPAAQIANAAVANPTVTTNTNTAYKVTANIGSCVATAQITVNTAPYPFVFAGADTTLCFNEAGQLNGIANGTSFQWTPAVYLSNANLLNPFVKPARSTTYALSVFENQGCPKPGIDSVTVFVMPDIKANAGNDTAIVLGQDLQLSASGGVTYQWEPISGLSAGNIANPLVRFNEASNGERYSVYVYNQAGCADTAFINIKIYATLPTVFVPTGFTPDSDGRNDLLRPIAAGIKTLEYFSVFNRWGKLVFTTSTNGKGWDGTINGVPQASGTFVWMVKAVDYLGKPFMQKGTSVLVR